MHIQVKPELLAVKPDCRLDVIDNVAYLDSSHPVLVFPQLPRNWNFGWLRLSSEEIYQHRLQHFGGYSVCLVC